MQHNDAYISPPGEEQPQQFAALLFLVRMLLGELRRASPGNQAIQHVEAALEEMEMETQAQTQFPAESEAMSAARTAVRDAKQTLRSADQTVTEVRHSEEGNL